MLKNLRLAQSRHDMLGACKWRMRKVCRPAPMSHMHSLIKVHLAICSISTEGNTHGAIQSPSENELWCACTHDQPACQSASIIHPSSAANDCMCQGRWRPELTPYCLTCIAAISTCCCWGLLDDSDEPDDPEPDDPEPSACSSSNMSLPLPWCCTVSCPTMKSDG